MQLPTNDRWTRILLVLGLVLMSSAGWAATTTVNCPTEPKTNVPIVSGDTYSGTNCVLNTTVELDSFTFNASAGDTWAVVAGVGTNPAQDICMALNAPGSNGTHLYSNCTIFRGGVPSLPIVMKLAVAGTYTIAITEAANGTTGYNLSLERINPAPTDATALSLAKNITASVPTPTGQEAYTFYGATGSTYEIAISYVSGPDNPCFNVYQAGTTALQSAPPCTLYGGGTTTAIVYVSPKVTGTFVVDVYAASNDSTTTYSLELSCYSGTCPTQPPPPNCSLKAATPTYNASTQTLSMSFTLETPVAATWNGWLTTDNAIQSMWSVSEPVILTPITIPMKQTGVAKSGKVGILTTLTTPTKGITCSTWTQVNTGAP